MPASSSAAAPAGVRAAERRRGRAVAGIPLGRRTRAGRLRWYLVEVPHGRERSMCESLRRVLPADVLEDAFVAMTERWSKCSGAWSRETRPLYEGYVFAATRDAAALDKALRRVTLPARLVGSQGRFFSPVDEGALAWLGSVMDAGRVVRSSRGRIVDGVLHIDSGPLAGQEERVAKIDRHRRVCWVRVGAEESGFTVALPMEVPFKS